MSELLGLFQGCCDAARHEYRGTRSLIAVRTLEILAQVDILRSRVPNENPAVFEIVRKACCQMSEAIEMPFLQEEFACENGMSLTSFRRHFKSIIGLPPNRYLLELRVRKARSLLANTSLPITMVAEECGFPNAFYFTRYFKQLFGVTPSSWRTQNQPPEL